MQEITTVEQSEQYLIQTIQKSFNNLYSEAQAHLLNAMSPEESVGVESFSGAEQTKNLMKSIANSVKTLSPDQQARVLEQLRGSTQEGGAVHEFNALLMPRLSSE